MAAFHILSAGYDRELMQTRSMLLRHAGFVVDEAYTLAGVLSLVTSDSIDAVLLCHTIPRNECRWLISSIRDVRRLLPIICIKAGIYDSPQDECLITTNEPADLLAVLGRATQTPHSRNPGTA